jgi:hypothetical protein
MPAQENYDDLSEKELRQIKSGVDKALADKQRQAILELPKNPDIIAFQKAYKALLVKQKAFCKQKETVTFSVTVTSYYIEQEDPNGELLKQVKIKITGLKGDLKNEMMECIEYGIRGAGTKIDKDCEKLTDGFAVLRDKIQEYCEENNLDSDEVYNIAYGEEK